MNKIDTGQMSDYLGLLADNALRSINTESFIELAKSGSMRKATLSEALGISRPKLYKQEARITDEQIRKRLIPFVQIADLAFLLFEKNRKKTMEWLMAPNHIFFNASPFHMAMGGRAEVVLEKLQEWSREAG